jgi:hypothetical protein
MTKFNLNPIKKGDTYTATFTFYTDKAKTVTQNVSTWTFKAMGKSSGTTIFTWNDADFVQTNAYTRTLTLSSDTTSAYTVGECSYELQVTYPDTTQQTMFGGFVTIQDQVTS